MILKITLLLCLFVTVLHAFVLDSNSDNRASLNDNFDKLGYVPLQLESVRKYTAGQRVTGDYVVGQAAKNQRYRTAQNVNVTLRYPTSGFGKLVTYVEITVNQTSETGNAVFTEGGIGQHFAGLLIQAFNTYQMDYSALVYGY